MEMAIKETITVRVRTTRTTEVEGGTRIRTSSRITTTTLRVGITTTRIIRSRIIVPNRCTIEEIGGLTGEMGEIESTEIRRTITVGATMTITGNRNGTMVAEGTMTVTIVLGTTTTPCSKIATITTISTMKGSKGITTIASVKEGVMAVTIRVQARMETIRRGRSKLHKDAEKAMVEGAAAKGLRMGKVRARGTETMGDGIETAGSKAATCKAKRGAIGTGV